MRGLIGKLGEPSRMFIDAWPEGITEQLRTDEVFAETNVQHGVINEDGSVTPIEEGA